MTAGVYAIINTANGMAYIGSSINIEQRWRDHLSCFKYNRFLPDPLLLAWQAMGKGSFEWIVLEEVADDDALLIRAEQSWVDQYGDRAYNKRRKVSRQGFRRRARPAPAPDGSA